ncbi:MAG: hypothetical protein Q8N63_00135 [Nanoarchaeota archaeon]|nr:hypothetical protein [Nanoarchaeota archaeon]
MVIEREVMINKLNLVIAKLKSFNELQKSSSKKNFKESTATPLKLCVTTF